MDRLNRRGLPSWIARLGGWSQTSAAARFPTQRLIETSRCPSFLRTANASHGSEAAVLLAANIVFQTTRVLAPERLDWEVI